MITTPPPANVNAAPPSALDCLWPELRRLRQEYLGKDEFEDTPISSLVQKYPGGGTASAGGSAPTTEGGRP